MEKISVICEKNEKTKKFEIKTIIIFRTNTAPEIIEYKGIDDLTKVDQYARTKGLDILKDGIQRPIAIGFIEVITKPMDIERVRQEVWHEKLNVSMPKPEIEEAIEKPEISGASLTKMPTSTNVINVNPSLGSVQRENQPEIPNPQPESKPKEESTDNTGDNNPTAGSDSTNDEKSAANPAMNKTLEHNPSVTEEPEVPSKPEEDNSKKVEESVASSQVSREQAFKELEDAHKAYTDAYARLQSIQDKNSPEAVEARRILEERKAESDRLTLKYRDLIDKVTAEKKEVEQVPTNPTPVVEKSTAEPENPIPTKTDEDKPVTRETAIKELEEAYNAYLNACKIRDSIADKTSEEYKVAIEDCKEKADKYNKLFAKYVGLLDKVTSEKEQVPTNPTPVAAKPTEEPKNLTPEAKKNPDYKPDFVIVNKNGNEGNTQDPAVHNNSGNANGDNKGHEESKTQDPATTNNSGNTTGNNDEQGKEQDQGKEEEGKKPNAVVKPMGPVKEEGIPKNIVGDTVTIPTEEGEIKVKKTSKLRNLLLKIGAAILVILSVLGFGNFRNKNQGGNTGNKPPQTTTGTPAPTGRTNPSATPGTPTATPGITPGANTNFNYNQVLTNFFNKYNVGNDVKNFLQQPICTNFLKQFKTEEQLILALQALSWGYETKVLSEKNNNFRLAKDKNNYLTSFVHDFLCAKAYCYPNQMQTIFGGPYTTQTEVENGFKSFCYLVKTYSMNGVEALPFHYLTDNNPKDTDFLNKLQQKLIVVNANRNNGTLTSAHTDDFIAEVHHLYEENNQSIDVNDGVRTIGGAIVDGFVAMQSEVAYGEPLYLHEDHGLAKAGMNLAVADGQLVIGANGNVQYSYTYLYDVVNHGHGDKATNDARCLSYQQVVLSAVNALTPSSDLVKFDETCKGADTLLGIANRRSNSYNNLIYNRREEAQGYDKFVVLNGINYVQQSALAAGNGAQYGITPPQTVVTTREPVSKDQMSPAEQDQAKKGEDKVNKGYEDKNARRYADGQKGASEMYQVIYAHSDLDVSTLFSMVKPIADKYGITITTSDVQSMLDLALQVKAGEQKKKQLDQQYGQDNKNNKNNTDDGGIDPQIDTNRKAPGEEPYNGGKSEIEGDVDSEVRELIGSIEGIDPEDLSGPRLVLKPKSEQKNG